MSSVATVKEETTRFEGRTMSKDEFSDLFFDAIKNFISLETADREGIVIIRILWEIARNIYDHNYCWGYVTMKEFSNGHIQFEIGNLEIPSEEFPKLPSYRPNERTGYKGGSGLGNKEQKGMIVGYAESIDLKLEIDPDKYIYRGTFQKQQEP